MSFSRANVVWQSSDGTWNQAFWSVREPDLEDDEWEDDELEDDEWDVEYDDEFEFVTTGHPTEESAWRRAVRDRPNPGGSQRCTLDNSTDEERAGLEVLAAACPNRVPYDPVER